MSIKLISGITLSSVGRLALRFQMVDPVWGSVRQSPAHFYISNIILQNVHFVAEFAFLLELNEIES